MNGVWFDGLLGQDAKHLVNSVVLSVNSGTKEKPQNWIDVVAFGKEMEIASTLVSGDKVFIAGTLDQNKYTNKNGVKIDKLRVVARIIKVEERVNAMPAQASGEDPFNEE